MKKLGFFKKATALMVTICMLLSMSACKSSPPTSNEASTAPTSSEATPTKEDSSADTSDEVKTLSVFINHSWYPTKTFTGIIPEEITEQTGVKLDPTIAVDDKQLGVMIASGTLPDLIYTCDNLDRLSNADLCYSYDDLISEYNIQWNIDPLLRGNALAYSTDNKIYCVPNHFSTTQDWTEQNFGVPMLPTLLYRKDLYEKLGSPKLETLDDLTALFGMVEEQMPDITPFTFDTYNWRFRILQIWTGCTWTNFPKQEDGTYKHYTETTNYYDMLKMLNGWYRAGYMTADNFAATTTTAKVPYQSGKAFCFTGPTQDTENQAALTSLDPSYISVESMPLSDYKYLTSDIGWSGCFITKNCSDPEAAIKLMAWMFTPEAQMLTQNGREGIEYTIGDNGIPVFSQEWVDATANDTLKDIYNPWYYFGGSAIAESFGRCASIKNYDKYYKTPDDAVRNLYENDPWIKASEPISGTDENDILVTLDANDPNGMIATYEAKVIMSDSDAAFEKNYQEYMDAEKNVSIEKLDAYMNKTIPEIEKRYQ